MKHETAKPEDAVAERLRGQIRSGELRAGDWLPAERRLAEDLKVNRRAVRVAIQELVESGLVLHQPHCRPVIASGGRRAPLSENARAGGGPEPSPESPQEASAASGFVALLMWHGGGRLERAMTAQLRIFWGMNQALAETGRHAVFMDLGDNVGTEAQNAAREAEQLRYALRHGFGGAVFYPYAYQSNRALIEEVRRTLPLVAIDRRGGAETDFVGVDNHGAMYNVVTHLAAQGHRRIAYITKNEQIAAVQERIRGYLDAMRDADLDDMVLPISIRESERKWAVVETIFRLPSAERPTAAAVFNDYCAAQLSERLELLGLSVPGDVAITGFDDIVPALPSGVGLTTAAQPYEEMGRKAVELILRRMADPDAPLVSAALSAPLIIRESSPPPAQS